MKTSFKIIAIWIPIALFIVLIIAAVALYKSFLIRDRVLLYKYDYLHANKPVTDIKSINAVYNSLRSCSYKNVDHSYLVYTKYLSPQYRRFMEGCTFYRITREDLYKRIVNNFRIRDLLPGDILYKDLVMGKRDYIYLNIRKDLLYKLLMLQDELRKRDYNHLALNIRTAYRYPLHNEKIKGAIFSEHIKGTALDIRIGDVDRNGYFSQADKSIVMDILERTVIGNEGGIGRYPGSGIIHFDVRGHRARWDHMKKKTVNP